MPSEIRFSREQREKVHQMFWLGRPKDEPGCRGKYTAKQIAEATGVTLKAVYKIAHGQQ